MFSKTEEYLHMPKKLKSQNIPPSSYLAAVSRKIEEPG